MDIIRYALIAAVVIVVLVIIASGYVKAPPDQAYIISGGGKRPRYLIGKSGIRIPFLQRVDRLSLRMLSVDVKTTKTIPTLDYINIMVDSVAVVKISNTDEGLAKAAENFLNRDSDYINAMVVNVLEGNLREIIGGMRLTEIMNDRKTFAAKVQENAMTDMQRMGLDIVSFNIQNIDDDGIGVIENLGIANTVAIQQNAQISKANAEKEIAVAQAEANKIANDARIASETAIAEQNNALALKQASLKTEADTAAAKADAAKGIEAQRQQKAINTEQVNAEIARADREAELKSKEVSVREQELDATVRKQADADRYAVEQHAQADLAQRQRQAEAELYTAQKKAEQIKAQAVADAEATRVRGQGEADAVRARGEAEAEAAKVKGLAEAEAAKAKGLAEAEAMDKKAEALRKYGQAALAQQIIGVLPDIIAAASKPIEGIDAINIYSTVGGADGEGSPAAGVTSMAPQSIKAAFDMVKSVTGVDLADVMRADTYDAKVNRNVSIDGAALGKVADALGRHGERPATSPDASGDVREDATSTTRQAQGARPADARIEKGD